MSKDKTYKLCTLALLLALEIILTRFCSITTTFIRIGFGFIPISLAGIMYGPLAAATVYAIGDLIGAVLFPSGPFFPGFTLSAALTGLIFGFVFYKRNINIRTAFTASSVVVVCIDLCLNTYWLSILYGNAFIAMLPGRIAKCILTIPIQTLLIPLIWNKLAKRLYIAAKSS